jgi:AraC family transcriptional regulator
MSNLESVHRAVQFIEQHLKEPMRVQDIADAVGYSLYHFCHIFSSVIGHSPYDYLIRRRLSASARELLETERKIIDVALDYQFDHPETFTRAFRRMFAIPPSQARQDPYLRRLMFKPEVTLEYIRYINCNRHLKPTILERGPIHLVGQVLPYQENPALWHRCHELLRTIRDQRIPGKVLRVTFMSQSPQTAGDLQMVGVEVNALADPPPQLIARTIPAFTWARFIKDRACDVEMTLDYIYQTWLPASQYAPAAPLEIEGWSEGCPLPGDPGAESEVFLPIRQKASTPSHGTLIGATQIN